MNDKTWFINEKVIDQIASFQRAFNYLSNFFINFQVNIFIFKKSKGIGKNLLNTIRTNGYLSWCKLMSTDRAKVLCLN